MFKVTAQIRYENRVVGYRFEGLSQSNKIIKNIPRQSLQQFCQTNSILNARYNTKTNSLVGLNGQDLRKIEKIQMKKQPQLQQNKQKIEQAQKAEQARLYINKYRLLNKEPIIKFKIVDDSTVLLTDITDKKSTGKIIIPQFITGISLEKFQTNSNIPLMAQPFSGCNFTEIEIQNSPGTFENIDKMFCRMFQNKLKITMWHDEGVISARNLFYSCNSLEYLELNGLSFSNLRTAHSMFQECSKIIKLDLQTLNLSKLVEATHMFSLCESLETIRFGEYKPRNNNTKQELLDTEFMFYKCYNLKEIYFGGLDLQQVKSVNAMFSYCRNLKGIDSKKFKLSKVENMDKLFLYCTQLKKLDLSNQELSHVEQASGLLQSQVNIEEFKVQNTLFKNLIEADNMFKNCSSLSKFEIVNNDISLNVYGQKISSTAYMFKNCSKLKSIDLSNFYFLYLQNAKQMFEGCTEIETIIMPKHDIQHMIECNQMFANCYKLKSIDLRCIKQPKLESVSQMFENMVNLEDVRWPNFAYTNIQYMNYMYYGCEQLIKIDLNQFKQNSLFSMYSLFEGCKNLQEVNLSGIEVVKVKCSNTTDVAYTEYMTNNGDIFKIEDGKFIVDKQKKEEITRGNIMYFNDSHQIAVGDIFKGCDNLSKDRIISCNEIKSLVKYK